MIPIESLGARRVGVLCRVLVLAACAAALAGCRNGGEPADPGSEFPNGAASSGTESPATPPGMVVAVGGADAGDVLSASPPSRAIPVEQNSPRAAAQAVALLGSEPGPPASDELAAHCRLLFAAVELAERSGIDVRRVALRPPALISGGVSPREYYLRVLASFVGRDGQVAWVDRDAADPAPLPGAREPATTLLVNILSYRHHDARWTEVVAELVVTSADGRVVGQRAFVERLSADRSWSLRLDPLRWTR